MKWLFKWLFRLFIVVVVLVVVLLLSLDSILKAAVRRQIRADTGMDVKIGKFSVGLLSPIVTVENFKLYNTAEFGGTPFLDIRELHLEYDRAALAQRTLHVKLMRLNLAELCIVKDALGRTNLVAIPANSSKGGKLDFAGIDVLNLSIGRVRFLDLKNPAQNREFNANLQNQILRDVKTPGDLYGVLILIWLRSGGGFADARIPADQNTAMLLQIHRAVPAPHQTAGPRCEAGAQRATSGGNQRA